MTQTKKAGFLARNRWVLALGTVVASGVIVAGASTLGQSQALAAQESHIMSLEAASSQRGQQEAETSEKNGLEGLGISASRVRADTTTIGQLLSLAFTWDSGDAYETARESLKDRFGLSEKDAFLQTFIPPSRFNVDVNGKRRYYVDAIAMNSALGRDVDVEVVEVAGTRYRYAVMADIEVGADGPAQTGGRAQATSQQTAIRRVLVYVTVDTDGTVSDLVGIPPSGSTRSSR